MRRAQCWWCDEDGIACEEYLDVVDGHYVCPAGHHLADRDHLSRWTDQHIELMQGSPTLLDHYDYRGDRMP